MNIYICDLKVINNLMLKTHKRITECFVAMVCKLQGKDVVITNVVH